MFKIVKIIFIYKVTLGSSETEIFSKLLQIVIILRITRNKNIFKLYLYDLEFSRIVCLG